MFYGHARRFFSDRRLRASLTSYLHDIRTDFITRNTTGKIVSEEVPIVLGAPYDI